MFDPLARKASKLDRESYLFALKNYSELKVAHVSRSLCRLIHALERALEKLEKKKELM